MENNNSLTTTTTTENDMIIRNVAAIDFDYVWMEQQTSYNNGLDWEVTGTWKQLRTEQSMKAVAEWCSRPPVRIKIPNSEVA